MAAIAGAGSFATLLIWLRPAEQDLQSGGDPELELVPDNGGA